MSIITQCPNWDAPDVIYGRALKAVNIKTQKLVDFPEKCPYSLEQLLDIEWLPICRGSTFSLL